LCNSVFRADNWANNLNSGFTPWDGAVTIGSLGDINTFFLWTHTTADSTGALAGELDYQNAADAGLLRLILDSGHGRLEYSTFKNSRARTAGAVNLLGSGSTTFDVIECVFVGNTAFLTGGALAFKGSALAIVDSIFLRNGIQQPAGGVTEVPVYVRVHTGSMGVPPGGTSMHLNLPVWKVDGSEPLTVCNGVCSDPSAIWQKHLGENGAIDCTAAQGGWRPGFEPKGCIDGEVPGNETVYGSNRTAGTPHYDQASDYATVLNLSPGPHKLWYGAIVYMSDAVYSWNGM
jgi:hypothetical protein